MVVKDRDFFPWVFWIPNKNHHHLQKKNTQKNPTTNYHSPNMCLTSFFWIPNKNHQKNTKKSQGTTSPYLWKISPSLFLCPKKNEKTNLPGTWKPSMSLSRLQGLFGYEGRWVPKDWVFGEFRSFVQWKFAKSWVWLLWCCYARSLLGFGNPTLDDALPHQRRGFWMSRRCKECTVRNIAYMQICCKLGWDVLSLRDLQIVNHLHSLAWYTEYCTEKRPWNN